MNTQLAIETALNADRWITNEAQMQEAAANLLDSIRVAWCHVPNGGLRNKRTGAMLKRQGVKPGVPDVLIFDSCMVLDDRLGTIKYFGCAIELKYGKNRPSDSQLEWLDMLNQRGWYTDVAYSMLDVVTILETCGYVKERG